MLHRSYQSNELLARQVYDASRMAYGHPLACRNVQVIAQLVAALVQSAADAVVFAEHMIHFAFDQAVASLALHYKIQLGVRQLHTVVKSDFTLSQVPRQCCSEHTIMEFKCLGQGTRRIERRHIGNFPPAFAAVKRAINEGGLNSPKDSGFRAPHAPE